MRPGASYRGARRNEAKTVRKSLKRRTVGDAMISYAQIQQVNDMHKARRAAEARAKAEAAAA